MTPRAAVWIAVMDERRQGTLSRQSHQPRVQQQRHEKEIGHQVRALMYGRLRLKRGSGLERAVLEYCLIPTKDRDSTWHESPMNRRAVDFVERRLRKQMESIGLGRRGFRAIFGRKRFDEDEVETLRAAWPDGSQADVSLVGKPPTDWATIIAPRGDPEKNK